MKTWNEGGKEVFLDTSESNITIFGSLEECEDSYTILQATRRQETDESLQWNRAWAKDMSRERPRDAEKRKDMEKEEEDG